MIYLEDMLYPQDEQHPVMAEEIEQRKVFNKQLLALQEHLNEQPIERIGEYLSSENIRPRLKQMLRHGNELSRLLVHFSQDEIKSFLCGLGQDSLATVLNSRHYLTDVLTILNDKQWIHDYLRRLPIATIMTLSNNDVAGLLHLQPQEKKFAFLVRIPTSILSAYLTTSEGYPLCWIIDELSPNERLPFFMRVDIQQWKLVCKNGLHWLSAAYLSLPEDAQPAFRNKLNKSFFMHIFRNVATISDFRQIFNKSDYAYERMPFSSWYTCATLKAFAAEKYEEHFSADMNLLSIDEEAVLDEMRRPPQRINFFNQNTLPSSSGKRPIDNSSHEVTKKMLQ